MPKVQTDYSNTIIYKLCCKNPEITDIYVGHTTNFTQRKNHHRIACDSLLDRYVYQYINDNGGWNNWTMIQLETYNCIDKRKAEAIEHSYIVQLGAKLNSNKPYAMYKENPKEYQQEWYKQYKEEILEKTKQRYEENKEEKIQYQLNYAQEHKEQISEYQKQYKEINQEKLSEQKKIYRENHKEMAKIQHKKWREKNKDKLKEKNSQIINCECGQIYLISNKNRHLKTKKHMSFCNIIENKEDLDITEEEQQKLE